MMKFRRKSVGALCIAIALLGSAVHVTHAQPNPMITETTLPGEAVLGDKYTYEVKFANAEGGASSLKFETKLYDQTIGDYKTIFTETYSAASKNVGLESEGSFQLTSACMKVTVTYPVRHAFTLQDIAGNMSDLLEVDVTCRERTVPPTPEPGQKGPWWFGNWEFTSITGSLDVSGYDPMLGRIWVRDELLDSIGGTIDFPPPASANHIITAQRMSRSGFLRGKISEDGRNLNGTWYQEPTYTGSDTGTFSFQISTDGNTITGTWSGNGSTETISGQREGTTPPPSNNTPPPTSGGNSLKDFDTNSSCALEDSEFFKAVDQWLTEAISNSLFFSVLDAWIGQSDICAAVSTLKISTQQTASGSMRFSVENAGASLIHIEIYDLQGSLMHLQSSSNGQLVWNMRSVNGKVVANGVYLYRVSVIDSNGNASSEIRKLLVLR